MTNREFRQRLAKLLDRQKKEAAAAALKKPPAATIGKVKTEKSA
jgi:hypothetical protein